MPQYVTSASLRLSELIVDIDVGQTAHGDTMKYAWKQQSSALTWARPSYFSRLDCDPPQFGIRDQTAG